MSILMGRVSLRESIHGLFPLTACLLHEYRVMNSIMMLSLRAFAAKPAPCVRRRRPVEQMSARRGGAACGGTKKCVKKSILNRIDPARSGTHNRCLHLRATAACGSVMREDQVHDKRHGKERETVGDFQSRHQVKINPIWRKINDNVKLRHITVPCYPNTGKGNHDHCSSRRRPSGGPVRHPQ